MEAETKKVVEAGEVNPTNEKNEKRQEKKVPLPKPIMMQDHGGAILVRIAIDEKHHEKRYYRVASHSGATINLEDKPYRVRRIKCPINVDSHRWETTHDLFAHFIEKGYQPAVGFKV
ncbi:MAG: hypothetical protein NC548_05520 [Lachnospiraceae bacterium]|nr:hypothetical protein [Lachnospiraceae bacterium]